jgi:hypothetical protein
LRAQYSPLARRPNPSGPGYLNAPSSNFCFDEIRKSTPLDSNGVLRKTPPTEPEKSGSEM